LVVAKFHLEYAFATAAAWFACLSAS
jgi:hypothetical protein